MVDGTDHALLERYRRGDAAAFRMLVVRYQRPVYNAAFGVLRNADDARDVAQSVFLRVAERAEGSLGAVDDEKGIRWTAYAGVQHVTGETPWYVRGNFDYGWDIPPGNSSLWLRTAAGYVRGNPAVPISNFYFGGFGNNYADSREIKRYRDMFSYPGFGIDAISGQSFVRPMLEWNVTPDVFESVGTPALHLAWMRPAVFASALWTDVESSGRRQSYGNVGGQVDLSFTVLHHYPMTLSFGYALGFGTGKRSGGEWMASLKIR